MFVSATASETYSAEMFRVAHTRHPYVPHARMRMHKISSVVNG